jgi:hypothetical protein
LARVRGVNDASPEPPVSDGGLVRNTLLAGLLIVGVAGALGFQRATGPVSAAPAALRGRQGSATAASSSLPSSLPSSLRPGLRARSPRRTPLSLTPEQRAKGYGECNLPDPGEGSYAPARPIALRGQVFIPVAGGHTDDMGFDVVLHFHGLAAVKKGVVGEAQGVVLAGLDLGSGSSAYSEPFRYAPAFGQVLDSIQQALRAQSGDERAHVRHLALSAWSAGYGAVSAILTREGPARVDAVILLDGLHASYATEEGDTSVEAVDTTGLTAVFDFANAAVSNGKLFYFSHSRIETEGYASTTKLAARLLGSLELRPLAAVPDDDPLGLQSYADRGGFHVRAFGGTDERAHCDHTRNLGEALRELVLPAWGTPPALPRPPR